MGSFCMGTALFLELFRFLLSCVKLVDARSLKKSFFPSVEWVTVLACFHFELSSLDSAESFKAVSARTAYLNCIGIWMDILFHKKKICRFRLIRVSRSKGLSNGQHRTYQNRLDAVHSTWCPKRDLNSHTSRQRLLRPSCLPFHHPGECFSSNITSCLYDF